MNMSKYRIERINQFKQAYDSGSLTGEQKEAFEELVKMGEIDHPLKQSQEPQEGRQNQQNQQNQQRIDELKAAYDNGSLTGEQKESF